MTRAALIVTALGLMAVTSSASAYRVLERVEEAYELSLGVVRLPANARDTVVFTPCSDCRTVSLPVTAATRYFVNGSNVELAELHEIADDLRGTASGLEDTNVYVYFDIASLRVNRLALSFRN